MHPPQLAAVALIAFGLTEFFLRRGATARSLRAGASDRGTTPLIFAAYATVIAVLFLPKLRWLTLPRAVAWAGAAVAIAGLLVRWWAMLVLGRFYTRTLTTTPDQTVITRGPYRWVRHPGYLGSLLTWLGAAAASANLLALLVAAILLWVYARRIAAEEAMLGESLGPPYVEYQRRSWRLLPLLFRRESRRQPLKKLAIPPKAVLS
jgi:protein-S-isoprenylcysteine O-methyltransferase Ste14